MTDYYKSKIERLKKELEKSKEHDENTRLCTSLYDLYRTYVDVGFTEEQAWEIFIAQVKRANN